MQKKDILIYGAGMSGLVCAINLARDGHQVIVRDREKGYGGDPLYNPSTHTTPIDVKKTSEYIGIDVSSVFYPLVACPFYFHDTKAYAPHSGLYTVERGNRATSLDTLLYGIACKEGVKFEFNTALKKEQIPDLPPQTIIACGLTPSAYEMLNVPYLKWYGWISRGEIGFSNYSWIWWDESITEYGYLSSANNYYFNLLFSNRPVTQEHLDKYRTFMRRNEGVEHDNWRYVSGAVPLGSPDNPRLFKDNLIYCGTISGAMDPVGWFGILGALITGKVAAMGVSDPARAQADFDRFNRYFKLAYAFKNKVWYPGVRPYVGMMEKALRLVGERNLERVAAKYVHEGAHIPFSIPGYAHLGCY